ncbi:streptolysin associated protein SagB [Sphaerisporangium krabiense]|uniref:SagB-type dehydrogenase family enzyme n=1 Tax=Sphaerisporangium krabiense TaxID=763782 RepID=A0A7W8Z754_9ACTN|nr:SagB/ThcOx family dehydrogenase [Sphaerisporangium krabiense]MBB5628724.1 SagB-type dehydrogenase family enzyme [Sphaerisporangium krabiense]GII60437.1 streptolysin associated protein SagB [Sphaerisporangium krabiense]
MDNVIDPQLAEASCGVNAYRMLSPDLDTVGLVTHQAHYDNLGETRLPRVAEEFIVAGRYAPWDREAQLSGSDYFGDVMATTLSIIDDETPVAADTVALPPPVELGIALDEAVIRRRSVRRYTGDPVALAEVGTMLRFAAGVTGEADAELMRGGTATFRFRAVPSGGGLYPVEVHLAALDVPELAVGTYRYSPVKDVLVRTGDRATVDRLRDSFAIPGGVISIESAAAIVMLVARPWRSMRKYGPRGMRFVLHECGGMSQNVHLAATGLGIGTTDCSSYVDDLSNEALGLDGVLSFLAHTIFVGWPG